MSKSTGATNAARIREFLNTRLQSFEFGPSSPTRPYPTVRNNSSTFEWAETMLAGWTLADKTAEIEGYKTDPRYQTFQAKMAEYPPHDKLSLNVNHITSPVVMYPFNEADNMAVVNKEILDPVYEICQACVEGEGVKLQLLRKPHTISEATGMRVDAVYALRRKGKEGADSSAGLLLVQAKQFRHIKIPVLQFIAEHRVPLDNISLAGQYVAQLQQVFPEATQKALIYHIAILQEAIQYGEHYGTDVTVLTDYETGVILHMPNENQKEHGDSTESRRQHALHWECVGRDEARDAIAYLCWREIDKANKQMKSQKEIVGQQL